jgi:hypothetical protein
VVSSLSPLRVKTKAAASILRSTADLRSFRKLYDSPRPVICEVLVVSFSTISYVRVGFDSFLPKLNFHIKFLEVHVILNLSQDAMWYFLTKFN